MNDDQIQQLQAELTKTSEQLQDTQHYVKEIQIHYSLGALILAFLVAVVFQTFSYLIYGAILTDLDETLYMFSLLIGPAALFLLLLHLYELYGIVKRGEKSIPFTLDLMYFIFLVVAFATMIGLNSYYQRHDISSKFLTTGWSLAVALLCTEVFIALLLAKYIVTIFIAKRLPHFFDHPPKKRRIQLLPAPAHVIQPKHVYYFKRKPDASLWEKEDCFVRYKK